MAVSQSFDLCSGAPGTPSQETTPLPSYLACFIRNAVSRKGKHLETGVESGKGISTELFVPDIRPSQNCSRENSSLNMYAGCSSSWKNWLTWWASSCGPSGRWWQMKLVCQGWALRGECAVWETKLQVKGSAAATSSIGMVFLLLPDVGIILFQKFLPTLNVTLLKAFL